MKKRLICATLAAVMLLSVFAVGPFQARAESNLTTSDMGEAMIKAFEGFNETPKWDNKQNSVGWGCSITAEEWEVIDKDPDGTISEAGAQMLLDRHLAKHEAEVNSFANKHGLTFTQGQFDALVSLSFNIGGSWMSKSSWHIYKAVTSGDMGAYIAYAFALYSTSGGVTTQGHLKRRLLELDMYLYGNYDTEKGWPEDVRYILFDGNGGSTEYNPHGFNINYPVEDFWVTLTETPTGTDAAGNPFTYEFAGWFTEPVGGEQITVLDESLENGMILYAHWKNPTTGQIDDLQPGTAVDVKVKATSSVTMREGPCSYYTTVRTIYKNELLHITRVTTGKDGYQWGLTAEGWVRLDYTNYGTTGSDSGEETLTPGTWATITASSLKVRTGPGTDYTDTGSRVKNGDVVQIVQTQMEGTVRKWGQLTDGNWICLEENGDSYATIQVITEEQEPEETPDVSAPDISGAITVTKVEIKTLPSKTEYALCGSERVPEVSDGRIKITLSDGTSKWIYMTRGMITGFDNSKLGTNTLTVTVGGASAGFDVQVVPTNVGGIEVITIPNKGIYVQGVEQLDLTGCKLRVDYSMGGSREVAVTADMVTGFDNATVGTKTLTVTYEGFTDTFEVQVVLATVEFMNYDGSVISTAQYEYGAAVTAPEDPARPADEHGEYEFVGWDKAVTACAGNATYAAVFRLIYPMGDVDRNMKVDEDDAIYLLWHVFYPEEYAVHVSVDYDGNGSVNEDDAIYLLWHVFYPNDYPLQ